MSYWNSGTCYHLFTTDGAATKDSGSWKQFLIHPHMAFSQTVEEVCLNARPKTLTGYYLSDPVEVYAVSAGESTYLAIKVTSNSSRNNIHMQIINPYYESGGSGPNMESSGKFFGEY
jgi:hypothetical protein